jgi:hypothetical protein
MTLSIKCHNYEFDFFQQVIHRDLAARNVLVTEENICKVNCKNLTCFTFSFFTMIFFNLKLYS